MENLILVVRASLPSDNIYGKSDSVCSVLRFRAMGIIIPMRLPSHFLDWSRRFHNTIIYYCINSAELSALQPTNLCIPLNGWVRILQIMISEVSVCFLQRLFHSYQKRMSSVIPTTSITDFSFSLSTKILIFVPVNPILFSNIPISIICKTTTSLSNISATNNMTRQRALDISASTHTQLTACSSFDSSSSSLESSSLHSNTLYAAKFCKVRLPASCLPLVPDNKDACSDDGTCRIPAE